MAKKNQVPKTIAGVRLPKSIRKARLTKNLFGTALGRAVVADALIASAAALIAKGARTDTAHKVADAGGDAVKSMANTTQDMFRAVSEVVSDAITDADDKRKRRKEKKLLKKQRKDARRKDDHRDLAARPH